MKLAPTPSGGRMAQGDTPWGKYHVEAFESFADADIVVGGRVVGKASMEIRTPPQRIPAGFDPKTERRGCCDPPPDVGKR